MTNAKGECNDEWSPIMANHQQLPMDTSLFDSTQCMKGGLITHVVLTFFAETGMVMGGTACRQIFWLNSYIMGNTRSPTSDS